MHHSTPWCNGSTSGFGPLSLGSNPGGVATLYINCPKNIKVLIFSANREAKHLFLKNNNYIYCNFKYIDLYCEHLHAFNSVIDAVNHKMHYKRKYD